jgi:cell division protein ZapA
MAHVVVTIAGRTYRMACDDGEEARLEALARLVEEKIHAMREGFGDIGEQRVVVMAAIAIADEAADARAKFTTMEAEIVDLRARLEAQRREANALEERVAKALDGAASRIERAARDVAGAEASADGLP